MWRERDISHAYLSCSWRSVLQKADSERCPRSLVPSSRPCLPLQRQASVQPQHCSTRRSPPSARQTSRYPWPHARPYSHHGDCFEIRTRDACHRVGNSGTNTCTAQAGPTWSWWWMWSGTAQRPPSPSPALCYPPWSRATSSHPSGCSPVRHTFEEDEGEGDQRVSMPLQC